MSCPSRKQIIDSLYGGISLNAEVQRHLETCPLCQGRIQEETELTDFFRTHYQTVEPNPFLWQRIERQLSTAPAPVMGIRTFLSRPVYILAAGFAFVVFLCSTMLLLNTAGPSQETILAAIDAQYMQTLNQFDNLDHNPFNGRLNQVAASDQNPFFIAETAEKEPDPATNPFRPFKPSPAKDIRR